MVSERDRIFQERLRKYQEEQNRLADEDRRLQWQWQEYQKLSQDSRERGASYDHGRWERGWQEGCGHRQGTCATKSEWVTFDPNNPDHRHLKKGKSGGKHSRDWDLVHVTKSTDPNKPYHLPYSKHPNRRVQERLDRQRDIGKEIDKIKAQREKAITEENTRKLRMLEGQFKQERTDIKKFFKQRRQQIHPESGTIGSPRRRHPSGARARYVPPKRRSRPRPRPRPRR